MLTRLFRLVVVFLSLFMLSGVADAQTYTVAVVINWSTGTTTACSTFGGGAGSITYVDGQANEPCANGRTDIGNPVCPPGGVLQWTGSTGGQGGTAYCQMPGYAPGGGSGSGSTPSGPTCTAGQSSGPIQVTMGWSTTYDLSGKLVNPIAGGAGWSAVMVTDSNGCEATPAGIPTSCSIANEPSSNGYYQAVCVANFTEDGNVGAANNTSADQTAVSMPTTQASPASPTGSCPKGTSAGTDPVGDPMCVGTSASGGTAADPTPPTLPPPPAPGAAPTSIYDPTTGDTIQQSTTSNINNDGSVTTTVTTTTILPNGTKTISTSSSTGNNVAGQPGVQNPPSTSTGSGTGTGTSGSGTGSSSSSSSGNGSTGSQCTGNNCNGTAICGVSPLPDCEVRIDETGVPGQGAMDSAMAPATTAVQNTSQSIQSGLTGASQTSVDTSIGWLPTIPSGSCTEVTFTLPTGASGSTSICQYLPIVSVMFDLLWCGFLGFAIMGLVSNATQKS